VYRGSAQLGDEIVLGVLTVDADGIPVLPTEAPLVDVYDSAGHPFSKRIPILDRGAVTGQFQYKLFLSRSFTVGHCVATYRWTTGSYEGYETDEFDILPGGDGDGIGIASFYFKRPDSQIIVQQKTSGVLTKHRNPRV
jgi:hypothetical protein